MKVTLLFPPPWTQPLTWTGWGKDNLRRDPIWTILSYAHVSDYSLPAQCVDWWHLPVGVRQWYSLQIHEQHLKTGLVTMMIELSLQSFSPMCSILSCYHYWLDWLYMLCFSQVKHVHCSSVSLEDDGWLAPPAGLIKRWWAEGGGGGGEGVGGVVMACPKAGQGSAGWEDREWSDRLLQVEVALFPCSDPDSQQRGLLAPTVPLDSTKGDERGQWGNGFGQKYSLHSVKCF